MGERGRGEGKEFAEVTKRMEFFSPWGPVGRLMLTSSLLADVWQLQLLIVGTHRNSNQ